jgi:hypothetical protein
MGIVAHDGLGKLQQVAARIVERASPLIEQLIALADADGCDLMLIVHDHDRALPGRSIDASVIAPRTDAGMVLQVLLACCRTLIYRGSPAALYTAPESDLVRLLSVRVIGQREHVMMWNPEQQPIGELVLRLGQGSQLATRLGCRETVAARQGTATPSDNLECPECHRWVRHEPTARAGDWAICEHCTAVLRFAAGAQGVTLRATTLDERSGAEAPDDLEAAVLAAAQGGRSRPPPG